MIVKLVINILKHFNGCPCMYLGEVCRMSPIKVEEASQMLPYNVSICNTNIKYAV